MAHAFKVNDQVRIVWNVPPGREAALAKQGLTGVFRVVRLLPSDTGDLLYRLRAESGPIERSAAEHEMIRITPRA